MDTPLENIAMDSFDAIPPREDAELLKRTLAGLYGRQDLQDLSEGRTIIPSEYDHNGRYVGPAKQETPKDDIPF